MRSFCGPCSCSTSRLPSRRPAATCSRSVAWRWPTSRARSSSSSLLCSRWRRSSRPDRAGRSRSTVSLPLLALESASYDVRFGGADVIRDRYVFYLAPLLLLATATCLFERQLPLLWIAAATVFFATTAALANFKPVAGIWVDSPEAV